MLDTILARYPKEQGSLVMILLDAQAEFGWLPPEVLDRVARELDLPRSKVLSVATFYNAFSLEPRGRHIIRVCMGTACHVKGAPRVLDAFARELDVAPGETTADKEFTLEGVRCVGCCGRAPVVEVDEEIYGDVSPVTVGAILKQVREDSHVAH